MAAGFFSVLLVLLLLAPLITYASLPSGRSSSTDSEPALAWVSAEDGPVQVHLSRDKQDQKECLKYELTSKQFCECIVNRTDNFLCEYDCKCHLDPTDPANFGSCESSSCDVTGKAIATIVLSLLAGFACCVGCCVVCFRVYKHRRTVVYTNLQNDAALMVNAEELHDLGYTDPDDQNEL